MSAVQQLLLATGAAKDPYYSNVALLLHMDGADGSQTLVDSGPLNYSPANWTFSNNASYPSNATKLTTSQKKFGTASLLIQGYSSAFTATSSNFRVFAQDFTFEAWVRANTIGSQNIIGLDNNSKWVVLFRQNATNFVAESRNSADQAINQTLGPISTSWTFVAVTRQAGVMYFFYNGSLVATVANTRDFGATSGWFRVGSNFEAANANLDDYRVTIGVARYTSSFTPPTAPFPDS